MSKVYLQEINFILFKSYYGKKFDFLNSKKKYLVKKFNFNLAGIWPVNFTGQIN
jgi:hypothetical protein